MPWSPRSHELRPACASSVKRMNTLSDVCVRVWICFFCIVNSSPLLQTPKQTHPRSENFPFARTFCHKDHQHRGCARTGILARRVINTPENRFHVVDVCGCMCGIDGFRWHFAIPSHSRTDKHEPYAYNTYVARVIFIILSPNNRVVEWVTRWGNWQAERKNEHNWQEADIAGASCTHIYI